MDRESQIEEMAKCCIYNDNGKCNADSTESNECDLMCKMYGMFANLEMAGYCKQSEVEELKESIEYGNEVCKNCQNDKDKGLKQAKKKVAREIIGQILSSHTPDVDGFFIMHESEIAELKKKYTEE